MQLSIIDLKEIYNADKDINVYVLEIVSDGSILTCKPVNRFKPFNTHLQNNMKVFKTAEDRFNYLTGKNKENKMELKIEDLKAGDELVCVDFNGLVTNKYFLPVMGNLHLNPSVIVKNIRIEAGIINVTDSRDINIEIFSEQIVFFKKKEQSQYTFDDLIDVTVQAVKDGVIRSATIRNCEIGFMDGNTHYKLMPAFDCEEQINIVKSLYKETFVIECADDIKRIKKNAMIRMENENEVCAESDCINHGVNFINTTYGGCNFKLSFISLKGATVEQSR